MRALERKRLSEMTADSIIQYILENGLKPGDSIPTERELSETLQVGKTSIREGIALLKSAGLLASNQGSRVSVQELSLNSFLGAKRSFPLHHFLSLTNKQEIDLIETRRVIEIAAIRKAIHQSDKSYIARLKECYIKMKDSLDNPAEFIKHDTNFHKEIFAASGNSILLIIYNLIIDLYSKQFQDLSNIPNAMNNALTFHKQICECLEKENTEEAINTLEKHLLNIEDELKKTDEKDE